MQTMLTIVIASLPSKYEKWWVEQIKSYCGDGIKVILSIPIGYYMNRELEEFKNIDSLKIVQSPKLGQVQQRCYGFNFVKTRFVMQMDDDVKLEVKDVYKLINSLESLGERASIAPRFAAYPTGSPYQSTPNLNTLEMKRTEIESHIIHGIPWGERFFGRITPSGFGYHYPLNFKSKSPMQTEWLPGGCLIHYRENLISSFEYPFSGNAYVEDLIHSHLLIKKGITLFYEPSVTALTRPPTKRKSVDLSNLLIPPDYKARIYYLRMIDGSMIRLHLYYIFRVLSTFISLFISAFRPSSVERFRQHIQKIFLQKNK